MTTLQFNPSSLPFIRAEPSTLSARGIDWTAPSDDYTLKTTEDKFRESKGRDLSSGTLNAETEKLVDAVLTSGKAGAPKVQVKTFAVDGVQSKDIMFIARVPPEPNRPNIVLFVPDQTGKSFLPFESLEQMNQWLKEVGSDPEKLEKFSSHFSEGGSPVRDARVKEVMRQFANDDINAVVGPFANEQNSIFKRLDREANSPPPSINGLSKLQEENQTETGRTLYSGYRPDGEKVKFEFDAYGNFMGLGDKGNFYFVQNGINANRALRPMTQKEFDIAVERQISENVGADDLRGLYDSLLEHLEHPFEGIAEALEVFGVNKSTADTVERYLDNPFSALLLDLNKNNQIGKVFGLDKATMDGILKDVGDVAQGFVPVYGQARALGSLLAKAIRNEPLSNQEKRDLADMLALKPDSPARKNIPPLEKPSRLITDTVKPNEKPPETEVDSVKPSVHIGMRQIQCEGETYFVASKPDAGDGVHYLLRVQDPKNPAQLVNSGKVARPGEGGVWQRNATGAEMTQMGGPMSEMQILGGEIHTFTDVYKNGTRLNVVVHGVERSAADIAAGRPSKVVIDGKAYGAKELVEFLKKRGINPADSRYENIRLLVCYAADGGDNSFASEFQKAVGKPVKAFEGTVTLSHGATAMEYVRSVFEADIRALHPGLDQNSIDLLVTAEVEKFIAGKVIRVNKADGTLVQTQSAPQGATIGNQIIRIEYKPVHFTGQSSSPTAAKP